MGAQQAHFIPKLPRATRVTFASEGFHAQAWRFLLRRQRFFLIGALFWKTKSSSKHFSPAKICASAQRCLRDFSSLKKSF